MTEVEVHLRNGHAEGAFRGGQEDKAVCNCCPYGYHIDLDFVRYCEKLAKANGEPSVSKKMRRERRRQRQSMEVLLGLTNPVIWNIEQLLPTVTQESSPTSETPTVTPIKYSPLYHSHDGLDKAVLDFEATLERTSKKKTQITEVANLNKLIYSSPTDFNSQTVSREEPVVFRNSQDMSPFVELDIMSIYNMSGGSSPGPLQNIREQMAISLKRMRELEDKVKLIPSLETEVQSLKNEKYELLERLHRLKSSLRHRDYLDKLKEGEKKSEERIMTTNVKPLLRDVGVSCKVLTRDVGVIPVVQKCRTVGTETVALCNGFVQAEVKRPCLISIKSQVQPDIETRSTLTDLRMNDVIEHLEKKKKTLAQKRLDEISLIPVSFQQLNKGTQTSAKESAIVLKVIEKKETGVQVDGRKKENRDIGFTAKPKTYDVGADFRPRTREYGSSDDRITDLLCDRCKNIKTRNVGVGCETININEPKIQTNFLNRSKSFQHTDTKTKFTTRSIGVGTLVPVKKLTSTKGVGTHDLTGIQIRHTAVNTVKIPLVDTGSGSCTVSDESVCIKCRNEAKPPVKSSISQRQSGDLISRELQPSKIPRPKSNQSTPVTEKKRFLRQDTYTKLPQQSPCDTGIKSKPGVKSISDSPSDERAEVVLRRKTKPTLGQSPSSADKSITKGLKDLSLGSGSDRFSGNFDEYYFDYDENYEDDSKRNSALFPDQASFQPINDEPREKIKPSKEMKAAMKVVNDSLSKYPSGLPKQLKNACNIIQQEWFKISSTASANPLDVEDYLDSFDEVSSTLLEFIVNMVDNNGNTAMHYAVSHGNFDVVSILLDSKVCNINKMNAAGYTCIMLVSLAQVRSETHRQVVKRLFQLADVNIRAKQHGQTALMLAVSHGRLDMVKLLLEAGANPNIQDGDGSTALMCAAEHGHLDIVKHILAHPECDTSIVDCDGSTALAIAMEAGNRDIGVLLYAREHFSSSRGNSPYTSLKQRRSKSSSSPHPRTPTSPNPNRKSDHSV